MALASVPTPASASFLCTLQNTAAESCLEFSSSGSPGSGTASTCGGARVAKSTGVAILCASEGTDGSDTCHAVVFQGTGVGIVRLVHACLP